MVEDLVPENLEVWKLYVILDQIMDFLIASYYQIRSCKFLKNLITELDELYLYSFRLT